MYYSREMLSNAKWMNYLLSQTGRETGPVPDPRAGGPGQRGDEAGLHQDAGDVHHTALRVSFHKVVLCHTIQIVILL